MTDPLTEEASWARMDAAMKDEAACAATMTSLLSKVGTINDGVLTAEQREAAGTVLGPQVEDRYGRSGTRWYAIVFAMAGPPGYTPEPPEEFCTGRAHQSGILYPEK